MKKYLIPITISSILFSCKNETLTIEKTEDTVITQTPIIEQLNTAPQYIIDSLINNTTSIEGTMYNSGGSFSLSSQENAQTFLSFISDTAPSSNSKNQVGHLMFLNNGNNLLICSVYLNDNEVFARFDINGESFYNVLTGQASSMFTNVQIRPKEEK